MRFIDRIIVLIFSLVLIAVAVGGAFLCFDFQIVHGNVMYALGVLIDYRWFVLAGSVVLFVLGLLILFGSAFHHKSQSKSTAISTKTHGDDVQISVGAIDCIVDQIVKGYAQVKSVSTVVAESPDGVRIKAKTVVNGDINIPELAESLRRDIKIQLETMVGLQVKEVKIVVTDVVAKPIVVDQTAAEFAENDDAAKITEAEATKNGNQTEVNKNK